VIAVGCPVSVGHNDWNGVDLRRIGDQAVHGHEPPISVSSQFAAKRTWPGVQSGFNQVRDMQASGLHNPLFQ